MAKHSAIYNLQHLWLQQLQLEFVDICRSYGVDLAPPVFEITDAKKELGAWCQATRTLRLSRHLIVNYSWSVTLQVLKHEMAHQLCSEQFLNSGKPHGDIFQQSCELLGVLPEYRCPGAILFEVVEEAAAGSKITEDGRKCMDRVEKLLALTESSNEHEAALAMQKANELIGKYNIQRLGTDREHRYTFILIDRKRKRIESYQRHICKILQDFFLVRVVLSNLYDPVKDDTYKIIEIMGTKENVTVAEYCYYFLENQLVSLWSRNRSRFRGAVRTEKNSYYLGLLRGFYQKLEEQKMGKKDLQIEPKFGELVVAEETRLAGFVGMRFPRLRKISARGVKVYGSTYRQGVETGKTISFTEGLTGKKAKFGGVLR
jgi:hypothetical protein